MRLTFYKLTKALFLNTQRVIKEKGFDIGVSHQIEEYLKMCRNKDILNSTQYI